MIDKKETDFGFKIGYCLYEQEIHHNKAHFSYTYYYPTKQSVLNAFREKKRKFIEECNKMVEGYKDKDRLADPYCPPIIIIDICKVYMPNNNEGLKELYNMYRGNIRQFVERYIHNLIIIDIDRFNGRLYLKKIINKNNINIPNRISIDYDKD